MDSSNNKRSTDSRRGNYGYRSGYGYGTYGGYGYGSGSPGYGYGETTMQRTLQDYLLILRERLWYIVVAFLIVVAAVTVYTYTQVPIFESTATVEIFRRNPTVMDVQQVMDSEVRSTEDLNTQVNILKSDSIVLRVAERLTGEDLRRFSAPYQIPGSPAPDLQVILAKHREIVPERMSLIIDINYRHPDKQIAAKVANLFADEYIAYNAHTLGDESMQAVDELEKRATDQRKKVDEIGAALQSYREKNNSVSLDPHKDIVTEKLKELNDNVTKSSSVLQEAETRWKQVFAARQNNESLLNLSFIAAVPSVSELQQQVANSKITVARLSQRYRAKHPQMIQAVDSLNEAEHQLQSAVDTAAAQVQADYQTALQNYTQSQRALAAQETDSLKLDRYALEYTNLERDFTVNEQLLEHILERTREASMTSSVENQNARIVDRAEPSRRPVTPNVPVYLGLGMIGGGGLGLALAFFVAYIDDRVKSATDIEVVVGLNLLGIIPEVKHMPGPDGMLSTIATRVDRDVEEAFSTLMSSLKLKEESKNAQCILVTSTIASEGKSFITSNLATTYAAHGERVIVIDCDLRRPALNRIFGVENLKGVIDVCVEGATLDETIIKSVRPNLDFLPTGGRSKSPTQRSAAKSLPS